jgi:hypothetical protein
MNEIVGKRVAPADWARFFKSYPKIDIIDPKLKPASPPQSTERKPSVGMTSIGANN